MIDFASMLKLKGIQVISMTKMKNNTLAQLSTESLYVSTSNVGTAHIENYETTTLFFMTVEMLLIKYLLYQEMRCEKEVQ